MIRSQTKRSIFSWVWRFIGITIIIPIIGELKNNLTQASSFLELIVSAFLSLIVGFFAVFAAAFTDGWGSPGQAPIMYDIYSWCSCAFYGVVAFSIILGMTSSETEE